MNRIFFLTFFIIFICISTVLSAQKINLEKIAEIDSDQLTGTYFTDVDVTNNGFPMRMWVIETGDFLVEFKPSFSNQTVSKELKSTFELVNVSASKEMQQVLESKIDEKFIDQTNGGFSVSDMPYGRENYIIPAGDNLYHNWSGEDEFTNVDLNTFEKTKVEPGVQSKRLPITEKGYQKYFMDELGISSDENPEDVLKSLSTDQSGRLMIRTINARLNNRDKLHDEYPVYKWVTGDEDRICFGTYTDDIEISRIACIDELGKVLGEGELSSDMQMMSQSGEFIAGTRQLDNGLQSVVLFRISMSE